jgi:hypothetical protein
MATYSLRYNLLPPRPPARQCGECVACCQVLRIDAPELQKATGVMCPNCTGQGCGIYAQRPQVCRDWLCTWMRTSEIPDEFRPDRLGVMFSFEAAPQSANPFERRYFVGRYLRDPATVDMDKLGQVLDYLSRASVHVPIWLARDGEMRLVHPKKPLADEIFQGAATQDAKAWRQALGA